MKSIKVLSMVLAGSILFASCSSYGEAAAGLTGAAVGSHIGRDIGYLAGGGHHGFGGSSSVLGSLIGAGVGAALGVSIQNGIERQRERRYEERQNRRYDNSQSSATDDYQTGGGNYSDNGSYSATLSNEYLSIVPLTYMDANGDGYVSKGETIEVCTYITNTTNAPLKDVTISLAASDLNYVALSSPLITTLSPGQKVRYTGRVYCNKAKYNRAVDVSVSVKANNTTLNSNSISIYMK